jgi:hypothetical protein
LEEDMKEEEKAREKRVVAVRHLLSPSFRAGELAARKARGKTRTAKERYEVDAEGRSGSWWGKERLNMLEVRQRGSNAFDASRSRCLVLPSDLAKRTNGPKRKRKR